jgi:hypothetical protein
MKAHDYSQMLSVMYEGALRGWGFGVIVIVLFVIFDIAWRIRSK